MRVESEEDMAIDPLVDLNKDGKTQTEEVVDFNNLVINVLINELDAKNVISKEELMKKVETIRKEESE